MRHFWWNISVRCFWWSVVRCFDRVWWNVLLECSETFFVLIRKVYTHDISLVVIFVIFLILSDYVSWVVNKIVRTTVLRSKISLRWDLKTQMLVSITKHSHICNIIIKTEYTQMAIKIFYWGYCAFAHLLF